MASSHELVERWFAQTIESYPHLSAGFLASERDPFRNPAGHALRSSMSAIVEELLGNWDMEKIAPALDAIVRLRAVQDFTPSQAVGFVFLLRPILLATTPAPPATIEARIDQLALMAFDHYMKCREQIAEVRADEVRRRIRLRPVLRSQ
jgi:hypothetical protein